MTDACQECAAAAAKVHGISIASCPGCRARELSRGPAFAGSMRAGRLTAEYKRLLEQTGLTHERVKASHDADAINRAPAK